MPTYRKRNLDPALPQTPTPLDPLRGGALMRRDRASAVHEAGDRLLSHGRRILLRAGLSGAGSFHVSDAAVDPVTFLHPHPTNARVVARLPATQLTPGHFPRLAVVALPSGMTEAAVDTLPVPTGPKGIVRLAADFDNGIDTPTRTVDLSIPASTAPNAAQPSAAGAAWSHLYRRRSSLITPANLATPAALAAWCDGATVALTLSFVGAPRAVEVVVYEEPLALAYDVSAGGWAAPMHSTGTGGGLGALPGDWPVVCRSASDAGHGAEAVMDAARRQCQSLGPVLFYASAWCESTQDFAEAEAEARSVSGTTWTELVSGATTAYAAASAGWSVSAGANARRVQESESRVVLRDATNVVPVRAYVYGRMTGATNTAAVRFESGKESIVEVAVPTGTTWAWRSASGFLRCGLGAQDPTSLQVRGRCSGATDDFEWRALVLAFADL